MGEREACAAARMWRSACASLAADAALTEAAWARLVASAPSDHVWHSLRNCVAYQAGIWQELQLQGMGAVTYPEAFQLAMALRHTPASLVPALLTQVLQNHSLASEMQEYALSLLSEEDPWESTACGGDVRGPGTAESAPLRDRRLFADCELAVMGAARAQYDAHAALVRAEYAHLARRAYVQLRVKILSQFSQIPKLYHSPEFARFEASARENIQREISNLTETAQ
ncbi:hypothetical protein ACJJTC_007324 [Scirpophaga incertulas]